MRTFAPRLLPKVKREWDGDRDGGGGTRQVLQHTGCSCRSRLHGAGTRRAHTALTPCSRPVCSLHDVTAFGCNVPCSIIIPGSDAPPSSLNTTSA